jgi:hypothetical protein
MEVYYDVVMDEKETKVTKHQSKMAATTAEHRAPGFDVHLERRHQEYLERRRRECPHLILLHDVLRRGTIRDFEAARDGMVTEAAHDEMESQ